MEALSIKSYNTYIKALNDLVDFGFIKMVERSKNQYSSNRIALSNFNKALDKANDKALDKALLKHSTKQTTKQSESIIRSTVQSNDSINKPVNHINNKQENDSARAYEMIKNRKPSELEIFEMQNKKQVENWKDLIDSFNDKMDIEVSQGKIEWEVDQLFPRLRSWTRSWIRNEKSSIEKNPAAGNNQHRPKRLT